MLSTRSIESGLRRQPDARAMAKRRLSRNYSDPWPKTPGRLIGTAFIRLYQLTLSSLIGNSCRHYPTCSEYGYESIARHGLWTGGWLAAFQVTRCGPFGTHGIDMVPERAEANWRWWAPWRLWAVGRK